MNNVFQFRPRADHRLPDVAESRAAGVQSGHSEAQELLDSLSAMFRAAGCPGRAESFRVEAGGRCG